MVVLSCLLWIGGDKEFWVWGLILCALVDGKKKKVYQVDIPINKRVDQKCPWEIW